MKRPYMPSSRRIRIAFGVLALLVGALALASVLGLDVHYDDEFLALQQARTLPAPRAVATANAAVPSGPASASADAAALTGLRR